MRHSEFHPAIRRGGRGMLSEFRPPTLLEPQQVLAIRWARSRRKFSECLRGCNDRTTGRTWRASKAIDGAVR
jgi:hypothetical protein